MGIPHAAAQINGTNDNIIGAGLNNSGYYQLPTITGLGGDMTVEGWVNVSSYANWSRMVDLGSGENSSNILLAVSSSTSGRPVWSVRNGSTEVGLLVAPNAIPTNTWVHLAGVVQANRVMRLYVNGVEVATTTASADVTSVNRTTNYIGDSNWGADALLNGSVADIRIWNTARSAAEIQGNMNVGSITGPTTGLVAAYNFGATGSVPTADLSGNSYNATQSGNITYSKFDTGTLTTGGFSGSNTTLNVAQGTLDIVGTNAVRAVTINTAGMTQSSGSVATSLAGEAFLVGVSAGQTGTYSLTGGTVSVNNEGHTQIGSYGNGTMNQSGGTFTGTKWIVIGRYAGSTGTYNLSGGTLNQTDVNSRLIVGEASTGTLNVSDTGAISSVGGLSLSHAGGGVGTVNLNGGTISTNRITKGSGGTATFNFNGGTLRALANEGAFMTGLNTVAILSGGATIDSNGFNITAGNIISGSGAMVKRGSGILTLSGANTFSGGLTVDGGTVSLTGSLANSSSASITVNNGGVFSIARDNLMGGHGATVAAPIVINAGGQVTGGTYLNTIGALTLNGGTLTSSGGSAYWGNLAFVLKGTVTASGDTTSTMGGSGALMLGGETVNSVTFSVANGAADADLLVSANLDNGGSASWPTRQTSSLIKTGAGKMVLAGSSSYTGTTTVSAGTLQVGNGGTTGTLGSGAVTNNAVLSVNRTNDITIANVISGSGSVLQSGTGATRLTASNTYTGGTSVQAGVLRVTADSQLGATSGGLVLNGGQISNFEADTTFSSSRAVTLGASGGFVQAGWNKTVTLAGQISGSGGLGVVWDAGTVLLSASNTYTGTTTIGATGNAFYSHSGANPTLKLGNANALPSDGAVVFGTSANSNTATLDLNGFNVAVGGLSAASNARIRNSSGTAATLTVSPASGTSTYAGQVAGAVVLVKNGVGTQVLSGDNSYSGGTIINAGTLNLSGGSSTGGNFTIGNGATLQVVASSLWFNGTPRFSFTANGGGTIDTSSGVNFIMGGSSTYTSAGGAQNLIKGSSGINLNGSTGNHIATFNVDRGTDANADLLVSTKLWNDGGIIKSGNGILTLSGSNEYTGTTDIQAGTLVAGSNSALGAGGHSGTTMSWIRDGATLALQGNISSGEHFHVWGSGVNGLGAIRNLSGNNALTNSPSGGPGYALRSQTTVGVDAGSLSIAGFYQDGGSYGLTKIGAGTLIITAASTYTGTTTISSGTLQVSASTSTGTASGSGNNNTIVVNDGATLRYTAQRGAGYHSANATINGGTITFDAVDMNFATGKTLTFDTKAGSINGTGQWRRRDTGNSIAVTAAASGSIISVADLNLFGNSPEFNVADGAQSADLTVSSSITGGAALNKTGAGRMALTGSNSYSGGTTITAGALQVGNGGTTGSLGTGAIVNNGALEFNRSNAVTVASAISGSGTLVQRGNGTTTLTSQTTHTGGTIVEAGTLLLSGSNRLAPSSSVTVNAGGNLRLAGNQTLSSIAGSGAITFVTSSSAHKLTIGEQSSTFAGSISGLGTLVKDGPGTFTLTGSNTYNGSTNIQGGTLITGGNNVLPTNTTLSVNSSGMLVLGGNQEVSAVSGSGTYDLNGFTLLSTGVASEFKGIALGGGTLQKNSPGIWTFAGVTIGTTAVVLNGGTIKLSAANRFSDSGAVTVNNGILDMNGFTDVAGTVTVNGGKIINGTLQAAGVNMDDGSVSGVLMGSGGFTKTGSGVVTINSTNTYTGETAIQGGTLETTGSNQLAAAGRVNVASGGIFKMGGDQTLTSIAGTGTIKLYNGSLTTGSQSSTFAGSLTGNGSLTKIGNGTLTLSGSNTFTGDTVLTGGTLVLANADALPTDAVVNITEGTTLQLTGTTLVGAIENNGGTVTGGTLVATLVSTQSGALDSVIANGEINGAHFAAGILKRGEGTTTIGAANTFTGSIKLQRGTLQLTQGGSFNTASSLVMSSGATMDLNSKNQTFAALIGTGGTVALGSGSLTVNNVADGVFGGGISGTGGLSKTGAGILELTGTNTYTGVTDIQNGELKLNGSLATSSLSVAAAATLSGTGTIAGDVTIAGSHTPGNSPGVQTIGGNLTYTTGSLGIVWELAGNTAALADRGTVYDGIDVGGDLTVAGSTPVNLVFDLAGSTVDWSDTFWDTDKLGTDGWLLLDVGGTAYDANNLSIVLLDYLDSQGQLLSEVRANGAFSLQQVGSDIYLTYTAIPEPSTYGLILGGLALAGAAVRRRRVA